MTSTPSVSAWTSGARRALDRTQQVAAVMKQPTAAPLHLAWALLMDEGRAGALLTEWGLSGESLRTVAPQLPDVTLDDLPEEIPELPWATETIDLLREAQHHAYHSGQIDEAGTDHLLTALLRSSAPELSWLQDSRPSAVDAAPVVTMPAPAAESPSLAERVDLNLRERAPIHHADLYRILDAAANRAREGLRVIEDYTRFVLNDRHLSGLLKNARHGLAAALAELPAEALLGCRDTRGDVGTTIETRREYHRTDERDVLIAAFKRLQEALRTLEEFSKVLSGGLAHQLERLRYESYTLEKAVLQTTRNRHRLADQQLYVLLTDSACPAGVPYALKGATEAGVRMFQVREKSLDDRALLEHCRRLRRWTGDRDALLIVNDRPDIAVLCGADGVHVGQEELTVSDARRIVGPDCLVGVSTHSLAQAQQAVLDGADYLGVGPVFPSQTKGFDAFPGLDFVRQVAAEISLPWFAIGGINAETLAAVIEAGATRVAVTQGVTAAGSPLEAAASLLQQLRA